jgi:hypothetical protein
MATSAGCDYKLPLSEQRAVERCAASPDSAKALKMRQANRDSVCKFGGAVQGGRG